MSDGKKTILDAESLARVAGGAMIRGSAGGEIIHGTGEDDRIYGLEGDDFIIAGSGDDMAYGGSGNDTIIVAEIANGGAGDDFIAGSRGADQLFGDDGNDTLNGVEGDGAKDVLDGGAGDDVLHWKPGSGDDVLQGREGHDTLVVGMSMADLRAALDIPGVYGLTMLVTDKTISFVDGNGNPASLNGSVTVGGETMRFSGIETIRIP